MLSFKFVVSYVEVEGFFMFGWGGFFFVGSFLFCFGFCCLFFFFFCCRFFFLAGGREKVNKSGNKEVSKKEIIFSFVRIYVCKTPLNSYDVQRFSSVFLVFTLLFQLLEFIFTIFWLFLRKFTMQEGKKHCIIFERYYFRAFY